MKFAVSDAPLGCNDLQVSWAAMSSIIRRDGFDEIKAVVCATFGPCFADKLNFPSVGK
jgi:hypothetical protein